MLHSWFPLLLLPVKPNAQSALLSTPTLKIRPPISLLLAKMETLVLFMASRLIPLLVLRPYLEPSVHQSLPLPLVQWHASRTPASVACEPVHATATNVACPVVFVDPLQFFDGFQTLPHRSTCASR
jgi:hypothetical protein